MPRLINRPKSGLCSCGKRSVDLAVRQRHVNFKPLPGEPHIREAGPDGLTRQTKTREIGADTLVKRLIERPEFLSADFIKPHQTCR